MKVNKNPHAGLKGAHRDFVKLVHDMVRAGGRNHREVFSDFLELAFCAIAKTTRDPESEAATKLEERYMRIAGNRPRAYIAEMPKLLGLLQEGLFDEPCDFLGRVAGELGALSEGLGQFFTPFELSLMMAEMTLGGVAEIIRERGYFTIDEPACGAGGMLLAAADVVQRQGFDPSICMLARATDLSGTAFQMAYLQLSLRGLSADVIHGNTLTLETFGSEITPGKLRFVQHHRALRMLQGVRAAVDQLERSDEPARAPEDEPVEVPAPTAGKRNRRRKVQQVEMVFGEPDAARRSKAHG